MSKPGLFFCIVALCTLAAGCNQHGSSTDSSAPTAPVAGPAKPAATADETTWGNYLAEQGKLHGKDVGMRPYIYVIPAGDSVPAVSRRESEVDAVVHSIGPMLMPGGILIVGGPDPKQTTTFITDVSKQLKEGSLKGVVVMVVSAPSEQAKTNDALKASGATTRFVAM